ncbi:DUF2442 domain-containing protein [Dyadobacter sp. BHUBP1]|uniref:DUF2442 domain-containing protein n=1 Tax=Dyadobacter sp. BHUBP1 TaxID=3424178 RepID=UPI003D33F1FD
MIASLSKRHPERSQPLKWFPRLFNASLAERQKFELSAFGIHWPKLDEDLGFEGFFTYQGPKLCLGQK